MQAGLVEELRGIVLHPRWMLAQVKSGGLPEIKGDLNALEHSASTCSSDIVKSVRTIKRCLEASDRDCFQTAEALSFSLLCRICSESRKNWVLRAPCLIPEISPLTPPPEALEAEVNCGAECVTFSPCGK